MGFLAPSSLLLGLSLAALVLLYLRSRARPTIEVSSLLLFEEVPAPVAKSRLLRLDLLFWLELLCLAALTLAAANFYVSGRRPVAHLRVHALVFDLGAGMSAMDAGVSRLHEATRAARELISSASAGDSFSIIGYALEAHTLRAATTDKDDLFAALSKLEPLAVAARPAALRGALLDARSASVIDLFVDRAPPREVVEGARPEGRVEVHQFGAPADNLAIVSLDSGVPGSSAGHCVLRNFAERPRECDLEISQGRRVIWHSSLIIEPRAQAIVAFGPLPAGGLIHAQILTPDALAADNQRYALAPSIAKAQALVLSPDSDVRDDLARLVIAINPNFVVTAMDPSRFPSSKAAGQQFALALLHDCSGAGVRAAARLFIFPEPQLLHSKRPSLLPVVGSVPLVELQSRADTGPLATPVLLGPSRIVAMPGWMDALARGAAVGSHNSFAVAGIGHSAQGEIGVIAFDVRNHLLLDPDRMDALVLTIDTLKRLIAAQNIKVVATGTFVAVSTFAPATVTAPDGSVSTFAPDRWGRVRFRPVEAGPYILAAHNRTVRVFANYYDATESDLSASATRSQVSARPPITTVGSGETYLRKLALPLVALALVLFLLESGVAARRASQWGARHV